MDFSRLPKIMQSEVLSYLTPTELISSLFHANQAFRASVLFFISISTEYRESYLGILPYKPKHIETVLKLLLLAEATKPKILDFAVNYTDAGMYRQMMEYWAQNMFEYNGTMYSAHEDNTNMTVCGTFLGDYCSHEFSSLRHIDAKNCLNPTIEYLRSYQHCIFPSDTFLKSIPARSWTDISITELTEWNGMYGPIHRQHITQVNDRVHTVQVSESETVGLVTHVGVARPIFTTWPVRTLMVFTKLRASQPDLRQWYDLTTMEEVLKRTDFPPVNTSQTLSGYSYVEFADTEGPLLWVQFTAFTESQIEIKLKTRRAVRHVEILIVDGEDRRSILGCEGTGLDIMYVVFGGIVLTKEARGELGIGESGELGNDTPHAE